MKMSHSRRTVWSPNTDPFLLGNLFPFRFIQMGKSIYVKMKETSAAGTASRYAEGKARTAKTSTYI